MKKIILTEDIKQDEPPAFLVFCHRDIDNDYMIFGDEIDAYNFAMEQEEKAGLPENSWKVYALWAADWRYI